MTRATEIQVVVLNKGLERATITLLAELYERIAAVEQAVRESALIQLQMIKQFEKVVDGAGALRKEIERMQGRERDDDDLPPAVEQ